MRICCGAQVRNHVSWTKMHMKPLLPGVVGTKVLRIRELGRCVDARVPRSSYAEIRSLDKPEVKPKIIYISCIY